MVKYNIQERGPFRVGKDDKGFYIASDDFNHDVWLRFTGDFYDDEQKQAYAEEIAKRLNAYEQD